MNLSETYRKKARHARREMWVDIVFAGFYAVLTVAQWGDTPWQYVFAFLTVMFGLCAFLARGQAGTNDRIADAWAEYERWMH